MLDSKLKEYLLASLAKHFPAALEIRIFLFGSRAEGNHQERSDYDLALEIKPLQDTAWTRFHLDVTENAPTLKGIDLIDLSRCDIDLRQEILTKGNLVYEKKK